MSEPPLIASSVYGLRTWRAVRGPDGDRITSPKEPTPWPAGGQWLRARCGDGDGHAAPGAACTCGIHAWHPRRSTARTVLSTRWEVPGVVEAAGDIDVHENGFRAARARPHAFLVLPGRNAAQIGRLAAAYGAEAVAVRGADDVIAWCQERGLGLSPATVEDLLGLPEGAALRRRRRERVASVRRWALTVGVAAALFAGGEQLASTPRGTVFGRTGEVHVP